MLEGTLCLEIMRLKIKVTNEILQSMFLSLDQSQGTKVSSGVLGRNIILA
jgi:hypothetical protein